MARHARAFSNFGQRVILRDEPVRTGLRSLAMFRVYETTCDAELIVYECAVQFRSTRLIVMSSHFETHPTEPTTLEPALSGPPWHAAKDRSFASPLGNCLLCEHRACLCVNERELGVG